MQMREKELLKEHERREQMNIGEMYKQQY